MKTSAAMTDCGSPINQNNKIMMTNFRNSLTWRDTIEYAIDAYSFVIRGEGEMSGREFAERVRKVYEVCDDAMEIILSDVERHIITIETDWYGATDYRYA